MKGATSEYDLNSAITFLLVGVGIGSILVIVFNPQQRGAPKEIDRWRTSGLQPLEEAKKRAA